MAGYGGFDFASPKQFSDWASYAGFNRTTGEIEGGDVSGGVKPPETLEEYAAQKIAPVVTKMQAVVPAAMQLMQGNVRKAANTLRQAPVPTAVTQPTTVAPVSSYDYTTGLE